MASSRVVGLCCAVWLGCAAIAPRPNVTAPVVALRDAAGEVMPLDALAARTEATVLVFWSGGCPCVRRYQARVDALAEQYGARSVQVIAVSSNAGERFDDALATARARGVRVPLWHDRGGAVARYVGAKSTPTVVVLDRRADVRFVGWLDNERDVGTEGRQPWLEQAIDGLLGSSEFARKTPTWGCSITRAIATESAHCVSP